MKKDSGKITDHMEQSTHQEKGPSQSPKKKKGQGTERPAKEKTRQKDKNSEKARKSAHYILQEKPTASRVSALWGNRPQIPCARSDLI